MPSLKNIVLYGLLLVSAATAAPAAIEAESSSLQKRKNSNKCEAHFHIDTSASAIERAYYTEKWRIDVLDKPGNTMGYNFEWTALGPWYATNPDYQIKVKTTSGLEIWFDGVWSKMLFGGQDHDIRQHGFTFNYGAQHFSTTYCENWGYKTSSPSNGLRREYDMWCEFDC